MADHLTEEEQIDAIKRWCKDNWLSVVVPILFAISAYTGWSYWNDFKAANAQQASDKYQSLIEMLEEQPGTPITGDVLQKAKVIANELQTKHSGGLYADLAVLISARIAVEESDLDTAEKALRVVAKEGVNEAIRSVAQGRLAKVLLGQERYDEALTWVNTKETDAVKALYAEIRGDIYMAQGQLDAAHTAFQEALDSLSPQQGSHRGILQFKLEGSATASTTEPAVSDDLTAVQE